MSFALNHLLCGCRLLSATCLGHLAQPLGTVVHCLQTRPLVSCKLEHPQKVPGSHRSCSGAPPECVAAPPAPASTAGAPCMNAAKVTTPPHAYTTTAGACDTCLGAVGERRRHGRGCPCCRSAGGGHRSRSAVASVPTLKATARGASAPGPAGERCHPCRRRGRRICAGLGGLEARLPQPAQAPRVLLPVACRLSVATRAANASQWHIHLQRLALDRLILALFLSGRPCRLRGADCLRERRRGTVPLQHQRSRFPAAD